MKSTIFLTIIAAFGQTEPPPPAAVVPTSLMFRAVLNSPGGELPFLFELAQGKDGLDGWLINGSERAKIPKVFQLKDALIFELEQYAADVYMTGTDWVPVGSEQAPLLMDGKWSKRIAAHQVFLISVVLVHGQNRSAYILV